MRVMMKISIPTDALNKATQDGSVKQILQSSLEQLRPEAVYFYPSDEGRNLLLFVDIKENSDVPVAAEPYFRGLNAKISFSPVMNLQDFQAAMVKLAH